MDDDWFKIPPPREFPVEWNKVKLRYRHPIHWHWFRIYALLFWLFVIGVLASRPWR